VLFMSRHGRIDEPLRSELASEGIYLLEERLWGTVTYRDYRAPGRYSSFRKELVRGAVVITSRRFLVWTGRAKHVNVPLRPPLPVAVALDGPERVVVGYDAGRFRPERSGRVEIRLRTPSAGRIVSATTGRV
jgi:hypothetical protein